MYPVSQPGIPARTSVGAVEINIYNPTAAAGTAQPQICPTQPVTYPPAQPPIAAQPMQPQAPVQQPQQNPPAQPVSQPDNTKKAEDKKEKKEIAPLTDEYIKTLENYLNDQNADIRLMGAKELLKRFKEDDTRKTDIALTNLLNKALQDPSQGIRLVALSTLDVGYALGDDLTIQLLQNMQKSDAVYNQDSLTASQILLKRAGKNLNVQSDAASAQPVVNSQPQTGQKLNVVAG